MEVIFPGVVQARCRAELNGDSSIMTDDRFCPRMTTYGVRKLITGNVTRSRMNSALRTQTGWLLSIAILVVYVSMYVVIYSHGTEETSPRLPCSWSLSRMRHTCAGTSFSPFIISAKDVVFIDVSSFVSSFAGRRRKTIPLVFTKFGGKASHGINLFDFWYQSGSCYVRVRVELLLRLGGWPTILRDTTGCVSAAESHPATMGLLYPTFV